MICGIPKWHYECGSTACKKNIGQPEERLVNIIESGSKRMYEMINNIMDLARGRLGGGFHITLVKYDLEKLLNQVSDELKMTWPDRIIVSDFNIDKLIECDPGRLSQLVSNLLEMRLHMGQPIHL